MTLRNPDPKFWKRLLLAFALAIAIHEIVIGAGGFLRLPAPATRPLPEASTLIVVARETRVPAATPTPTPAPTPAATPTRTPPPRATPAPRHAVAAPKATAIARIKSGGSKGGPKLEIHTPKVHNDTPRPIVFATATAAPTTVANTGSGSTPAPGPSQGAGVGTGTGAGAGSQQGAGGGTGGTGSGATNAAAPCGEPIFYGIRRKINPADGSFDETVQVRLSLGNGQHVEGTFGYPWHYPSAAADPFSPNTQIPSDAPIPAQLPPKGFDVSREPIAVRLTLAHTDPVTGSTGFLPCSTAKVP